MPMKPAAAISMAREHFPEFLAQREEAQVAEKWIRGENTKPTRPLQATREYKESAERTPTPWPGPVVTSTAQAAFGAAMKPVPTTASAPAVRLRDRS